MKEVQDINFDILKECCDELGIEMIPAESTEYITLTDEEGNKHIIKIGDNLFEERN